MPGSFGRSATARRRIRLFFSCSSRSTTARPGGKKPGWKRRLVNQQLAALSEQVTGQLNAVSSRMSEQVGTAWAWSRGQPAFRGTGAGSSVPSRQLDEANKRILEVGRSLSSLQEILRARKCAADWGVSARDLLPRYACEFFTLQYSFRSGRAGGCRDPFKPGLVRWMRNFPGEFQKALLPRMRRAEKLSQAFRGDVKRHVDAIANKYILPARAPAISPSCIFRPRTLLRSFHKG